MIKELIVHIGDRKTGSTSIQAALASRNWICRSANIIYPAKVNHNLLASAISKSNGRVGLRGEKLRERLLRSDADYAVISAENFEDVNPKNLALFIDTYLPELRSSMRLIGYIRPHADRLLSSFSERSKRGVCLYSLAELHDQFVRSRFLFYAPRMLAWRAVFGEHILFRPFDRSLLCEQDVVKDFFGFVLGGHDFQLNTLQQRNESLCLQDLVLLRELHSLLRKRFGEDIKQSTLGAFGRNMANLLTSEENKGTKLQLHRNLLEDVILAYREDAIVVDREFFTGSPMLNALESHRDKTVENEQSLDVAEYYSSEAIRQLRCWAEFIGRLMVRNQEQFAGSIVPPKPFSHANPQN